VPGPSAEAISEIAGRGRRDDPDGVSMREPPSAARRSASRSRSRPTQRARTGDLIDGVQALDTSLSLTAVSDEGCCVGLAADLHRCEADLDGEDISVAVPPRELESDSHQSGPWRRKEVADVIYVAGAKLIWKQNSTCSPTSSSG